MIKWIKAIFSNEPIVPILPLDYCKGKTNQELIDTLKQGGFQLCSGHMIIVELLQRINTDIE